MCIVQLAFGFSRRVTPTEMETYMSTVERRRSARILAFEEQAVIHAAGRDIPVRLVDISNTGALVGLVDMPAFDGRNIADEQQLELSMQHGHSIFQIGARVIRTTPQFVAVEFHEVREGIRKSLDAKLRLLETRRNISDGKTKAAAGPS